MESEALMNGVISFIGGFLIGSICGMVLLAVVAINAGREDDDEE